MAQLNDTLQLGDLFRACPQFRVKIAALGVCLFELSPEFRDFRCECMSSAPGVVSCIGRGMYNPGRSNTTAPLFYTNIAQEE